MRAAFTAQDESAAVAALAGGSAAEARRLRSRSAAEGPDVLWDDPRLLPALLMGRELTQPSAGLLLYVALRRHLLELGVDRRDLADYGAALVVAFGRGDRAWRVGAYDENRYAYVVELLEETARADGERQFRVLAHLGNFTLWLSGIFPDYIAARRTRKGGPDLAYYEAAGRSGFQRAAEHRLADRFGLAALLAEAGERFGELRVAMNRLSDGMMFPGRGGVDRLLRQVADASRHGPPQ